MCSHVHYFNYYIIIIVDVLLLALEHQYWEVDWEEANVSEVDLELSTRKRGVQEAVEIQKQADITNFDRGR